MANSDHHALFRVSGTIPEPLLTRMADMPPPDNGQVQTAVLVNGGIRALQTVENVLGARRYEIVFVDSDGGAYRQIKRLAPDLIILCAGIDDPRALQLLTMLKLDPQTCALPVLVCVLECDDDFNRRGSHSSEDVELIRSQPTFQIN